MARFSAGRNSDTDTRFRKIEQYLSLLGDIPSNLAQILGNSTQIDPTGGGVQGLIDSGSVPPPSPGPILEESVTWNPASGHSHEGAVSHNIALAGDASGNNTAVVVDKAKGIPFPVPAGAPDDQKSLVYDQATLAYILTTITSSGGNIAQVAKSADYTATVTDCAIWVDATTAPVTITLPTAVGNGGKFFIVKKLDASANAVTIDADGTETIDGSLTQVMTVQYMALEVVSDGANWFIV